ncbi:MAG: prepilin-type N-terminal cleavage/methylation domain-containing protein [Deltaproteobacteria bacterium]|nr:prepilin-type N-terminal cleavage/methylation domain-containing protein [Deltaproteobacteria bacterium]
MNGKRNKGFTLIEVMVAVAILSVSLMALMNLQSRSILASARAQRISVATLLARQKMALILLEIEKGIPKGDFPDEKEEEGIFEEEDFQDYYWKLVIKTVELPVPEGAEGKSEIMGQVMKMLSEELSKSAREVRLIVGWKEFEEEEEGITLVTHIVNPLGV